MNTGYQKQLQASQPKIRSHLTIKVHSTLMSRSCPSSRGPKPPVAPKPRLSLVVEGENSLSILVNGDSALSESETEQESDPEAIWNETDDSAIVVSNELHEHADTNDHPGEELTLNNDGSSELVEDLDRNGVDEEAEDCAKEDEAEREEAAGETADTLSLRSAQDPEALTDCGDAAAAAAYVEDDKNNDETCDDEDTAEAPVDSLQCEIYSEIQGDAEAEEGGGVLQSPSNDGDNPEEQTETPGREMEEPDGSDGTSCLSKPITEHDSQLCEWDRSPNHRRGCLHSELPQNGASEEEAGLSSQATNCIEPPIGEEYPYDVIGPLDENSEWQPERATKDRSGCYRFSDETDEDVFEPYAVIEMVPADVEATVDPELVDRENESDSEIVPDSTRDQETGNSNEEPYYVSTDDVAEAEKAQLDAEQELAQSNADKNTEIVDDYADIDIDCEDGDDFLHLECVSSSDYVEIGDDDDSDTERRSKGGKSIKERNAKRNSCQRNSCQPRVRLCNITVPAGLESNRTPELTNRVVFAHTTEAFEEDIEDLDCHIVPFFEDSDTDSDEHIYEEAGLDSEGENFISLDRKSIVTRSRSLSGKVPGYVPETVPEETSSEYQTHEYYSVALDQNGDPLKLHSEVNRLIPSLKPRRFLLSPRSYSMEGRELPLIAHLEGDSSPREERLRRKDDNLSLPCVIASSGSFSQRSYHSSSGVSTPTSMVDIPPPFELAYITKRPVTKSSPSLFIQHESSDRPTKKKSSFKRFLALKFRRKTDSKPHGDGSVRSSRSSSESSHHGPGRLLELDRRSTSSSPQLQSRVVTQQRMPELPATFLLYKDRQKRKGAPKTFGDRRISRVESFEDRSRPPFMPLPLTKPRSISFPSADMSDYENIPAMSSDYENIQIPTGRPTRAVTITEFFDDRNRMAMPSNENDGYVDMNIFAGIENKPQTSDQETESAYTEPFPVCPASTSLSAEEDHGRTSEEEEGCGDHGYDRQIDGRSRAFYVAKELVDSEREHVKALKHIEEDFREAVAAAVGEDGEPALDEDALGEMLGPLPDIYQLHCSILAELEKRICQWEESQQVVDVILTRRAEFTVFTGYISDYDQRMALLEESCTQHPAFSGIVTEYQVQNGEGVQVPLKHQLLQVIVRVLQYRMLLTDYLNNLSPDSKEYEDTQAALVIVSEVADQANDSLKQGENLLRLVHIEYSVRGKRDLLQPGRVFVKEGTLMKVSRKSRQPRHLFLMNDVMLYTYPQQDGKYRLKNTLPLSGMKISKPVIENVLNTLRIEVSDVTITLSASSCGEREDWFHTLSRAIADHAAGLNTFSCSSEAREKLWMSLGEAAPILVPVSQVLMCMNCTSDFSLTLRRHHCNACGKVVCRSCSRNRYPLKYLKDRMAKVCDHCYAELRKRGGALPRASLGNASPRPNRASRPLSAVFQSFQPPSLWRNRKSISPLAQVSVGAEGSTMTGSLQRCKKSKRKWKRLWFLLKDKVLYTFKAREDKVAAESLPLQGFTVKLSEPSEGGEASSVFQLYHKKTLYYTFIADDQHTARRWVNAMEEATVL
ncbi:FYVE, RhoGEF and PH domain-containing protein 5 isoform X3 [Clupea harengus]|uniref:FYVE, RhoGEF and PH domain-containing protein 5 isoform X3 n=1 Tax=Clupea harengus TaxID=7950 RepID=A0A6P8FJH0_CLUHA|nr:FYVE, RhoGEF and PH domain-containing protein 5 isoform X3 [Clupea harengus]XP_031423318.1 FYVE, RhoGEF and PH domain-containing protein 5 isoform X3 [Clupea harengus]